MATYLCWVQCLGCAGFLTISGVLASFGNCASAQIRPDASLGTEGSVVTPDANIGALPADLIEGGAVRGINLFHSFLEFNVGGGQRVYFANPAGIENILGRVTGTDPSDILGTLGVRGNANLFLINPNGIIFGSNAQLDIAGSFVATTAESLVFENGSQFSATNPQAPPLLTINLTPGLQYGSNQPGATIANAGNLAVGQDLTLLADHLDLQGQLHAGRDLTLLATDTVQVRDSIANPFIAEALGQLLVQGNEEVDIFALNHPLSGFFSRGAMGLRSSNTIGGDAHYSTGGSFRIEQLDGSLGSLSSPYESIIRAAADVSFDTYQGASLHIFAGGQVNIGTVTITGVETGADGVNFTAEEVMLSNGTGLTIDGSAKPTLDVRAGMNPSEIGVLGLSGNFDVLNPPDPLAPTRTSADITIGSISMNAPDGVVFLTNQYKPDSSLPGGAIALGRILTDDTFGGFSGNSGSVTIDSRSGVTVTNRIVTSSASGDAGDITLIANEAIALNNSFIISSTVGPGQGGDINLQAGSVAITNGGRLLSDTSRQGNAGNVSIVAKGQVLVDAGRGVTPSAIFSRVNEHASGNGGNITIQADSLSLTSRVEARTRGQGNGGDITIIARDINSFGGNFINSVENTAVGDAGDISIEARSVSLTRGSLQSNTLGKGDAGNVSIIASDSVVLDNLLILSRVNQDAKGDGGDIFIQTRALSGTNGTQLIAETQGQGNAGNVTIIARESVSFDGMNNRNALSGAFSSAEGRGVGNGGDIVIQTGLLSVTNGAQLVARTAAKGDAGNVRIFARGSVSFDGISNDGRPSGAFSSVEGAGAGKGGEIYVQAESLSVTNMARLDASTFGAGNAGHLTLLTQQLTVQDGGTISASTFGQRDAGDITVKATDSVLIANDGVIVSGVAENVSGNGGNIAIETPSLSLINGGRVETRTLGLIPAVVREVLVQQDANTAYDVAVEENNPVAYWRFDETAGSTAFDASGNNFNGIYQGGITLGLAGVSGAAAKFDGSSGRVDIGSITPESGLDIPNQSFTIEAWIKPNESPPKEQVYFGMHSAQQNNQSLHLRVYDNGSTRFGYWTEALNTPPGTIALGDTWYHLVTRYDQTSDTSTVFVNGNPIVSGSQGPFEGNAPTVAIGNWRNLNNLSNEPSFFNQPFDGLIDEVAVYNTALSPESIAAHYIIGQRNLGLPATFRNDGANAGNITVRAESISVSGVSSTHGSPSGFFSGTEGQFSGQGGDINITTDSLQVSDGGVLSTRTLNQSNSGNITLNVNDQLILAGQDTGLFANTAEGSSGLGGNVTIAAGELFLRDGAKVAVSSEGSGDAGHLQVTARSVQVDNQSKLTAETAFGNGGDIRLRVQDLLLLRHNSEISTTAGNAQAGGNGGNIKIDAGLIVAVPGENNDITANAFQGRGGNIDITTQRIFGIEFRDRPTPWSDITASSQFGVNGEVQINTPDVDPSRGLAELPTDLVDAAELIDRSCSVGRAAANNSNFNVTGRGGLPLNPNEALSPDSNWEDWRLVEDSEPTGVRQADPLQMSQITNNRQGTSPPLPKEADNGQRTIVEAQGWVKSPDGQVILVAQVPTVAPHGSWLTSPTCQSIQADSN